MEQVKRQLGQKIRFLRRSRNITQAQLAETVGLSTNYISQIETGVASPTFETLVNIAAGLEVPLKELFDFDPSNKLARN